MEVEKEQTQKRNDRETCPGCGRRARRPKDPFCWKCNGEYQEETATALAEGRPALSRPAAAKEKAKVTLQRLIAELKEKEKEEKEQQQPFWRRARQEIEAELQRQEIVWIDTPTRKKAVGKKFGELWNAHAENKKLSQRVYGLRKAIESLQKFLADLEFGNKTASKNSTVQKEASQETSIDNPENLSSVAENAKAE